MLCKNRFLFTISNSGLRFLRVKDNDAKLEDIYKRNKVDFREICRTTQITLWDMEKSFESEEVISYLWELVLEMISR